MAKDYAYIDVKSNYNEDLEELEKLLSNVKRPGNFFVKGSMELPMPKIEIDGLSEYLSYPLRKNQIKELIQLAVRAPYGLGEKTVVDISVRKVWQLPAEKVHVSGMSWDGHFGEIVAKVEYGLGCQGISVSAELYKLLVYDEGSFFLSHRDTEKADNMFGTLVVVLPSKHRGGELVVRHAGKEEKLDLCNSYMSGLTFAAFYADCEHEVLPVLEGDRVCLVYNLIQEFGGPKKKRKSEKLLVAPNYNAEVEKAAKILEMNLCGLSAPAKIAWILEHKYSSASLSFEKLKNADAAIVEVLKQAAQKANCIVHLAIVHILEWGLTSYHNSTHGYMSDDENADFEVDKDTISKENYIDGWINVENQAVDMEKMPLKTGELLPNESLDKEDPDYKSVSEATGNEGGTFERAYHRAALVIWHHDYYPRVLTQGNVNSLFTYFKDKLNISHESKERDRLEKIIKCWEEKAHEITEAGICKEGKRSKILNFLVEMGEKSLLEWFICRVIGKDYTGLENKCLASTVKVLDTNMIAPMLVNLNTSNMSIRPYACIKLLSFLVKEIDTSTPKWKSVLQNVSFAVVTGLKEVKIKDNFFWHWREPYECEIIVHLWSSLEELKEYKLQEAAVAEIISRPTDFQPNKLLVPVLSKLFEKYENITSNVNYIRLWQYVSSFLLARSGTSPESPKDWKQNVSILNSCNCSDCQMLQQFLSNPVQQVGQFSIRRERRKHLQEVIDQNQLDATYNINYLFKRNACAKILEVTKTRKTFEKLKKQHEEDVPAMKRLISLVPEIMEQTSDLRAKLCSATAINI